MTSNIFQNTLAQILSMVIDLAARCHNDKLIENWMMMPPLWPIPLKPGFHIVVTGRWVSLTIFRSHWSIWVVGNHCQSLAVFHGFRVVDSLSWSLTVFQRLHLNCYFWRQTCSLPVVGGLSGPLAVAKGILCCFHVTQMKQQGRWRFFTVVHGRWDQLRVYPSDLVVDCLWGSLLVFAKISFMFPYSRSRLLTKFQIR